ncbi:S41 family peptidase [Alkalihalobacillus sp. TS-13]|uniref:S41 family peptidase n=1 Tax=Alkalihalobacillus sp. TS-13 TaxID=2842455 RepID=UPI001C86996B|nr:S41 family peptidase [Alkalihalobacillus sp. TS-13]
MYLTIFDDVVHILHNDYSGCVDKKGWDNPSFYRNQIKKLNAAENSDEMFVQIVQDYLLDFNDLHMSFKYIGEMKNTLYEVGFKVRRYNDLLYVVSTGKEKRVKPGDVITALDGIAISDLVEIHKRRLMEQEAERENWNDILSLYNRASITDEAGKAFDIEVDKYEIEPVQAEYSIEVMTEDTLFLKLTDFMNHDAIIKLISDNELLLVNHKNLIIDVRVNKGGSDLAYLELLPYLFDGEVIDLKSFDDGVMLTNCTIRNVELRTKFLKNAFSTLEDVSTRNQINMMINTLEEYKGKGFVELDFSDMEESLLLKTKSGPESIILLTDVYCGSSGDSFVEICKNSRKVTVIGWPTLGLNDYSNLAVMGWDNKFELWYPTTKLSKVDEGKGMSGVGIQPDIYIPWSPDHIKQDIDLQKALEHLQYLREYSC